MKKEERPYTESIREKIIKVLASLYPLEEANNEWKSGFVAAQMEGIDKVKKAEL